MNILIVGALGMMGNYLMQELILSGHTVISSDYKEIQEKSLYVLDKEVAYFKIDITDPNSFNSLENRHIDSVVMLAGLMPATMVGYHPEKYFEVNTLGTLNVLNFCKKNNVSQIIFMLSHSDVAGYWNETIAIQPYQSPSFVYGNDHTIYSISKRAAVDIIKHFHADCGLKYAIFRCPNIYAWKQNDYFYVNGEQKEIAWRKIMYKAIKGEEIEIWGNCKIKKDLVYIKDLTWMIRTAIEKKISESIYNVATGIPNSLEEEILTIVDVFSPSNKKSKVIYRPDIKVPLNNHHYNIDNSVSELGFKPRFLLKEMFMDMKKEMQEENK